MAPGRRTEGRRVPVRPSSSSGRLFYGNHEERRRHAGVDAATEAAAAAARVRGVTHEPVLPTSLLRDIDSDDAEHSATAWVGIMHGVTVSALEFVLTLTNAVDQNAFESRASVQDLIFGGSTVMEAMGLLFALFLTVRNCACSKPTIVVGVPAVVIVEGILTNSTVREEVVGTAVLGVLLQTLSFLTYVIAVKVTNRVARIILICLIFVAPICSLVALFNSKKLRNRSGPKCWTAERMILILVALFWFTVPFVVELWESILIAVHEWVCVVVLVHSRCPRPCHYRSGSLLCSPDGRGTWC